MADEKQHDIADALAAFAAGAQGEGTPVDDEHEGGVDPLAVDSRPPPPMAPPARLSKRPTAPLAPVPAEPPKARRPAIPAPPPPPARPSPARRPESPVAPPAPEFAIGEDADPDAIDPSDVVLAPAADTSTFTPGVYRRPVSKASSRKKRQTMIPILLTTGTLLLVFASLKFIMGPDSPFATFSGAVVGVAAGAGGLLLLTAAVTTLGVRAELAVDGGR